MENNAYMIFTAKQLLRNFGVLLGVTFYPIDYASLIHPQHRHLVVVIITGLLPLPFFGFYCVLLSYRKHS